MAVIYNAELVPSKIELLTAWVAEQPWLDGADVSSLRALGAYRFDDPDGEVGIETHLVHSADGRVLQLPVTYRSAPLPGAQDALVGTMEHSVLGRRWVYDGCADPVFVTALATAILTGGTQAALEYEGERRESTTRVTGSGAPGTPVPRIAEPNPRHGATTTVISAGEVELVVRRVIDKDVRGAETLTGTWPGHDTPAVLAVVR
ncbi:MAG: CG0192-related protein [Jatrophihabitantaceae bacterium]